MSEKDPSLRLNMGKGKKIELTPHNTVLYTFLGRTAIGDTQFENASLNHTFVRPKDDKEGNPRGMYLFERFHPVYQDIAKFALEHSFPAILNQRQAPECDIRAYMSHVDAEQEVFRQTLEGVMPEDFR